MREENLKNKGEKTIVSNGIFQIGWGLVAENATGINFALVSCLLSPYFL
jgi:hypothetical protein